MSLKDKLLQALKQGEGETVEFKASFTGGEIFKTLSAFSNTKGGDLWIGVRNDGSILGADERQIKAIMHIKNVGSISNKEYQRLTGASRATATRDLSELVRLGIVKSVGSGKRVIRYIINESKMSQK